MSADTTDHLPLLFGIDFSSAPSRSKPVMLAAGRSQRDGSKVHCEILSLYSIQTLPELERFLADSPPWVAAIDMPFGLSRLVTETLRWPGCGDTSQHAWDTWARFYTALERSEIREIFKGWCDAHPAGQKFAHRASDRPARSSPSMKWVNPPVAYMLHAGASLLQRLDAYIPHMRTLGRRDRVALEAYPGFLARQLLGARSYKHDDARMQSQAREVARHHLIDSLSDLAPGFTLEIHDDIRAAMGSDGKGDALDAVLCVVQAALAWMRDPAGFDLPADVDVLEGWIVNVPWREEKRTPDVYEPERAASVRDAVMRACSAQTLARLQTLGADVTLNVNVACGTGSSST